MQIGMELLVANALIELHEKKDGCREVKTKSLLEYGTKIVKLLDKSGEETILFYSREDTNSFMHNYSDFYDMYQDDNGNDVISLKDGKSISDLREYFRANMTLEMLLAFINKESVQVLLNG